MQWYNHWYIIKKKLIIVVSKLKYFIISITNNNKIIIGQDAILSFVLIVTTEHELKILIVNSWW